LVDLHQKNCTLLSSEVSNDITHVHDFIYNAASALLSAENVVFVREKHLWLIPSILIVSAIFTVLAMVGVFLAWRHEMNKKLRHFYSYWLPPLMILLITCWMIAMGGSVATAISDDACLSGSQDGSTQVTLEGLLTAYGVHSSDPIYRYITAYTSNCSYSEDPSKSIEELEEKVQNLAYFMNRTMEEIDTVGLGKLSSHCNGNDRSDFFLRGAQDVTKCLTNIERGLERVEGALSCDRVHQLYDAAVNQSTCSDAASSEAWGFIFSLTVGVLTMILISLRESWQQTLGDDNSRLGVTEHLSSSGAFEQDNPEENQNSR
jgi:hypothetical protein